MMQVDPSVLQNLKAGLRQREGYRRFAYKDHLGKLTIGIGTMIEEGGFGIPEDIAMLLAERALVVSANEMYQTDPWIWDLPKPAQEALFEMAYQLGAPKLRQFKRMLAALQEARWEDACTEAYNSRWAQQTPARADHVAKLFRKCIT